MNKFKRNLALILSILMLASFLIPTSIFAEKEEENIEGGLNIVESEVKNLNDLEDLDEGFLDSDIEDTLEDIDISNLDIQTKVVIPLKPKTASAKKTVKKSNITITNLKTPASKLIKENATKFTAGGIVKAGNKKIKRVSFKIVSSNGNVIYYKTKGNMKVKSFNMKKLYCSKTEMAKLALGNYRYKVFVTRVGDSKATTMSNTSFSVVSKYPRIDNTKIASPYSLLQGQDYNYDLSGNISSNFPIQKIEVGIVNSTTGEWVEGHKYENIIDVNDNVMTFALDSISNEVNSALNYKTIPGGAYYYYRCVITNTKASKQVFNNYFRVQNGSDKTVGNFSLKNSNIMNGFTYNKLVAREFYPKGTITCSGKKIDKVHIYIMNDRGMIRSEKTKTNIKASTFNLNQFTSFNMNLLAGDKYTYNIEVRAVGESAYTKLFTSGAFTITKPFKVSSTNVSHPSILYKGNSFSLRGKIKNSYQMKRIKIGIVKDNQWYKSSFVDKAISTTSFDISSIDYDIKFGSLEIGSYRYKAIIWYNDRQYTVFNYSFSVKEPNTYWYKLYKNYKTPSSIKASSTTLRNKYVSKANSYVGKKETDKNWQKTIGYPVDKYAWCDVFVHFVAEQTNATVASSVTYPYNCGNIVEAAMKKKIFVKSRDIKNVVPQKGDLILWDMNYNYMPDHISIVSGLSDDKKTIYTIGGNEADQVSKNLYTPAPGDTRILGYIRW